MDGIRTHSDTLGLVYDWKKEKLALYEREAFYSEVDGDDERQAQYEALVEKYRQELARG